MEQKSPEIQETPPLKNFPVPWAGGVILACKRCQKRLRKADNPPKFSRMKKWIKAHERQTSTHSGPKLISIPCQDICPKNGVIVFSQRQLTTTPASFCILTSDEQMESFYKLAASADDPIW